MDCINWLNKLIQLSFKYNDTCLFDKVKSIAVLLAIVIGLNRFV